MRLFKRLSVAALVLLGLYTVITSAYTSSRSLELLEAAAAREETLQETADEITGELESVQQQLEAMDRRSIVLEERFLAFGIGLDDLGAPPVSAEPSDESLDQGAAHQGSPPPGSGEPSSETPSRASRPAPSGSEPPREGSPPPEDEDGSGDGSEPPRPPPDDGPLSPVCALLPVVDC